MPAAKLHEPAARQVKSRHGQNPHGIDENQAMAIARDVSISFIIEL
jgi:hypothetical protein